MKKIFVLTFALILGLSSVTLAADNESWIQNIKNKFQKKEIVAADKIVPPNKAKEAKKAEASKKERKDMTKAELAADITKNLDREEAVLNLVPG